MCQKPHPSFKTNTDEPPSPSTPQQEEREAGMRARVEEIAWTLANGDAAARVQAARTIGKATRESPAARSEFAIPSVIQPLVAMLSSANHRSMESALLALLNIAVRNERNKEKIASSGAVPLLVGILRSESSLRELATSALLSLSASNSNKPIIATSGAIPLLVKMIESGTMQCKADAVTALYNLSSCDKRFIDLLVPKEGARPLLALVKNSNKHSKIVDKATALLEIICESEAGRRAVLDDERGILTLVETIEEGSLIGTEHAVGILLSLCRNSSDNCRELILNEGPIPGLLLLTVEGTKKAGERAHQLLEILRGDSRPKQLESENLENVIDQSKVFEANFPEETAKLLLQDKVRQSMEENISKLRLSVATSEAAEAEAAKRDATKMPLN